MTIVNLVGFLNSSIGLTFFFFLGGWLGLIDPPLVLALVPTFK